MKPADENPNTSRNHLIVEHVDSASAPSLTAEYWSPKART
jgi:hypothetical protein